MPSIFTPNKGYILQATGEDDGTWGINLNAQALSVIDLNLGGRYNPDVSGSSNVTVTADQAQNIRHILTGVLTGNIQYIFPDAGGLFIVTNNTTGAFTLTLASAGGGATYRIPQGTRAIVFVNPDTGNVDVISSNHGLLLGIRYFYGSTTYTPSTPTVSSIFVQAQAAGGGGGGSSACAAGQASAGMSGSGGGYGELYITSGFSGQAITVGAQGLGGNPGNNAGTNGGDAQFGSVLHAFGGIGGAGCGVLTSFPTVGAGAITNGGDATGGNVNQRGGWAQVAVAINAALIIGGYGGSSRMASITAQPSNVTSPGNNSEGYGGGGAGAVTEGGGGAHSGGDGGHAVVTVWEFS